MWHMTCDVYICHMICMWDICIIWSLQICVYTYVCGFACVYMCTCVCIYVCLCLYIYSLSNLKWEHIYFFINTSSVVYLFSHTYYYIIFMFILQRCRRELYHTISHSKTPPNHTLPFHSPTPTPYPPITLSHSNTPTHYTLPLN